ncbi:transposase, partial [Lactobacillus crispatus]
MKSLHSNILMLRDGSSNKVADIKHDIFVADNYFTRCRK